MTPISCIGSINILCREIESVLTGAESYQKRLSAFAKGTAEGLVGWLVGAMQESREEKGGWMLPEVHFGISSPLPSKSHRKEANVWPIIV